MTKLQRTVLVIDPQETARLALRQALRHAPGVDYQVIEAVNGVQALAYLRQQQPDCLLLTNSVASGEGATPLQQIVQQAAPDSYPIILLLDDADAASALPAGVHDFLLRTEVAALPVQRAINQAIDKVALLRQLAEQRAFSQMMLERSPDCVKLLDGEGCLLSMNTPGLCLMEIDDFTPLAGREQRLDSQRSYRGARRAPGTLSSLLPHGQRDAQMVGCDCHRHQSCGQQGNWRPGALYCRLARYYGKLPGGRSVACQRRAPTAGDDRRRHGDC